VAVLIWHAGLESGIPLIDEQHRQLLRQFEALLMALHEHRPEVRVPGLLTFLADYVETHFSTEEGYMRAASYPGYLEHKAIHDDMRARVLQLVDAFQLDRANITSEVVDFLSDWLMNHIYEEDRSMAQFLLQINQASTEIA
jgi:hemerythrin-like metal-binding protein